MDLSGIGVQYMNSSYVPLGSSSGAPAAAPGLQSFDPGSFADILKKAQDANSSSKGGAAPVGAAPAASKNTPVDKTSKLYELCMELETFLVKNLIKSMRSTVTKSKLIDTGFAGEMYEDMLYDEYAKDFSRNANFGFAEMAYKELAGLRQKT